MNVLDIDKYYCSSQKPIKIKNNQNIVVMSFNIRCISKFDEGNKNYKVRMPYIRKLLEDENPDIIGFQEARVTQFKYLLNILRDYDYVYQKRDNKEDGEATPIFFKKNRFTCLTKNTFWLSDTYKIMSNTYNGNCFRTCSYVHLMDKQTKKELYVFNTHLDNGSDIARLKGVKLIKKVIKDLSIKDVPHLIIGDMNDFYHSEPINELLNGYVDASSFNHQEEKITFHNYGTDKQKIDYIVLSNLVNQLDYRVIETKFGDIYPSDHYPICVSIKI